MQDNDGVPAAGTEELPENVIDIMSRRRKPAAERRKPITNRRPYLQLLRFQPPELPAA